MPDYGDSDEVIHCSFCGKHQKQVRKMIVGSESSGVAICAECVDLCVEILDDDLLDSRHDQSAPDQGRLDRGGFG
jgi:ATP-dependent Clp protease ATP-binding subunit ClpX